MPLENIPQNAEEALRPIDVIDCQVGLGELGAEKCVAVQFYDPAGETVIFALPIEVAAKLATLIQVQLKMLDDTAASPQKH